MIENKGKAKVIDEEEILEEVKDDPKGGSPRKDNDTIIIHVVIISCITSFLQKHDDPAIIANHDCKRFEDKALLCNREAPSPTSPIVLSPNLSSFSLNLNENFSGHYTSSERPIGVKKSKLKRSKDEGLSSAMKLFETKNNRLGKMLSESATSKQQDGERLDRYIKAKEFRDETKILMKN
ncbi:hypothetical protein H5410_060802 [Solanum commersonii]|uniref:No apical meristem-associated C-terminal domain-containing protein n=1 Tax=Solanum commersonii TaxID=4109 RepID=A0A9J5W743_SOLCO|nr:hypothetical protein H5410_060802 [Solanum commersonii]